MLQLHVSVEIGNRVNFKLHDMLGSGVLESTHEDDDDGSTVYVVTDIQGDPGIIEYMAGSPVLYLSGNEILPIV